MIKYTTLFNSGTPNPQMSSCFLLDMNEDSITGIYKTLTDCAKISQYAGGIGLAAHKIRATGSYIAGTNGTSSGIVPMLRVYNNTARYVDQAGRRKGSFAMYLERAVLNPGTLTSSSSWISRRTLGLRNTELGICSMRSGSLTSS